MKDNKFHLKNFSIIDTSTGKVIFEVDYDDNGNSFVKPSKRVIKVASVPNLAPTSINRKAYEMYRKLEQGKLRLKRF